MIGGDGIDEVSYRPLIEDMTWSYSRISSFKNCPYAWYLRYIKHTQKEPQFYTSYGSFVHKIIEEYYKGLIKKEEMSTKFLFGFSEEVKGDRPSAAIVESYIKKGVDYFENFQPFPYNIVDVEMEANFEIEGIPMQGYIDLLAEEDGEYIIIDHKSRDLKPRSKRATPTENDKLIDKMLRQLYLYSTEVYNRYGKFPKWLCFNCFKAGVFIKEPFKMEAYDEAVAWARENVAEILDTNMFRPNIDFFTCKYLCGYPHECCYWDGGKFMWKNNNHKRGKKK